MVQTKNKAINNTSARATTNGLDQLCNWIYMNNLTVLLLKLNSLDRGSESAKIEADTPEELCDTIINVLPQAYAPGTKLFVRGFQQQDSYNNPYCTIFQLDRQDMHPQQQQHGMYGFTGMGGYPPPNYIPKEMMEMQIGFLEEKFALKQQLADIARKMDENKPAIEQYMPFIKEVSDIFKYRAMQNLNKPGINGVGIATNEPTQQKMEEDSNNENQHLLHELEDLNKQMLAASQNRSPENINNYNKAVQKTIERSIFILAESIQADVLAEKLRHLAVKSIQDPARFKMMMDLI